MNDATGGSRQRQRGRPRLAGALAMAAGIALLTAACENGTSSSSGGPTQAGGSTTQQKEVAYAQCMRAHGEPKFPDPTGNGLSLGGSGIDRKSPQFQAAKQACRSLLPALGTGTGSGS